MRRHNIRIFTDFLDYFEVIARLSDGKHSSPVTLTPPEHTQIDGRHQLLTILLKKLEDWMGGNNP
ncbi:MAG: hypothetical protein WAQ53_03995 [Thiofilum sp.]|uniref:hypothetical protein n=1 Tax=Thiofilum sp. TaxID=2212733 RepID=UPI0025CD7D90|nr:hypothetical protein [Thiofilum sp.]MBK8454853.1 hypothetical protein [Thiofilum sp.]